MRISIFGSGYVGLVQAAVFSEVGHDVICMDIDGDRIARIQNGDIPFFAVFYTHLRAHES